MAWWRDTRLSRTLTWYGEHQGGPLAGGIAYSALFSLFAGLAIGWSVFSSIVHGNPRLESALLTQLDDWLPDLIGNDDGALLRPEQLVLPPLSWGTAIAVVVMLGSAIGVMGALRGSMRLMLGIAPDADNAIRAKLGQLAGFALLGVAVLASATATSVAGALGRAIGDGLGAPHLATALARVGAGLLGMCIDMLVVWALLTFIARARRDANARRRDLWLASICTGAAIGALRMAGTTLVAGSASRNALLAPFAALVAILILANLVARLVLYACAWIHTGLNSP